MKTKNFTFIEVILLIGVLATTAFLFMSGSPNLAKAMEYTREIYNSVTGDNSNNHDKYANILFVDASPRGYRGSNWSSDSDNGHLSDFREEEE